MVLGGCEQLCVLFNSRLFFFFFIIVNFSVRGELTSADHERQRINHTRREVEVTGSKFMEF